MFSLSYRASLGESLGSKSHFDALAFVLLIIKQYYGPVWRRLGDDDFDDVGNTLESELIPGRAKCRLVGEQLFTEAEKRSFFFS